MTKAPELPRLPHPQVVPADRGHAGRRDRPGRRRRALAQDRHRRARSTTPTPGATSRTCRRSSSPRPKLGAEFGRRIREAAAGQAIESYGKACLVGIDGEYEHGNALLTNPAANPIRDALGGGKSWVPSTGKRGGPGTVIDVPLAHKDALYVRSHYDTVSAMFNDAPNRDELLLVWAFATRGRLNARLGGLQASEVKGQDGLV